MARGRRASRRIRHVEHPRDALGWQERHSPTKPDEVRINGKVEAVGVRRRVFEIETLKGVDSAQAQALQEIDDAVDVVAAGTGMRTQCFERVDCGGSAERSRDRMLLRAWIAWSGRLRETGVDNGVWASVVIDGRSLRHVDTARGWRKGTAKEELLAALDAWCEVRGWKTVERSVDNRVRVVAWRAEKANDGGDRTFAKAEA